MFPWPGLAADGNIFPVAFVPCLAEEDSGRSSKGNRGQVSLVSYILHLLRSMQLPEIRASPEIPVDENRAEIARQLDTFTVAVLTPYSNQAKLLKRTIPQELRVEVSTIDGFQGRESDIVVLSTVRSITAATEEVDLSFVADPRRLNVAWTRPKVGLIIVGNPDTLKRSNPLWDRAIHYCKETVIPPPDPVVPRS